MARDMQDINQRYTQFLFSFPKQIAWLINFSWLESTTKKDLNIGKISGYRKKIPKKLEPYPTYIMTIEY